MTFNTRKRTKPTFTTESTSKFVVGDKVKTKVPVAFRSKVLTIVEITDNHMFKCEDEKGATITCDERHLEFASPYEYEEKNATDELDVFLEEIAEKNGLFRLDEYSFLTKDGIYTPLPSKDAIMENIGLFTEELKGEVDDLFEDNNITRNDVINEIQKEDSQFGTPSISETGSLRYNENKPEIHQVPKCAIEGMAEVLMYGERKYGKNNWKKGNKFSVPYDSAMRHLMSFMEGEDCDVESGKHHIKHALTNLAMLLYYYENFPEMDDREVTND